MSSKRPWDASGRCLQKSDWYHTNFQIHFIIYSVFVLTDFGINNVKVQIKRSSYQEVFDTLSAAECLNYTFFLRSLRAVFTLA